MGKMCEKHCDILHLSLHSWYKGLKKLSNNLISDIRVGIVWTREKLTKWMMPAAVSHTEMKIEMSWASLKSTFPWDLGSCYEGNLQLSSAVVKLSRLLWIQMPLGHLDVRQASPRFCHFYPAFCKLLSKFSSLPFILQDVSLQISEWKPYGSGRLEDVEILQDVGNSHQSQSSQEP